MQNFPGVFSHLASVVNPWEAVDVPLSFRGKPRDNMHGSTELLS